MSYSPAPTYRAVGDVFSAIDTPVVQPIAAPAIPQAKAQIVFSVPSDAVIYLVGKKTKSTGDVRTFSSPLLNQGKKFGYPIRVELTRDGKTYTAEGMQTVRAGDRVQLKVEFNAEQGELSLVQTPGSKPVLGLEKVAQRADKLVSQK